MTFSHKLIISFDKFSLRMFSKAISFLLSFKVSLYDEYGQYLILKGGEVSITLEVTEVINSALYESLRN
jgi:hypothetical protein